MVQRLSRPIGITVLAVLEILIGIVGLLASLAIIGLSALLSTLPRVGSLLGTFGLVIGGVVLFFSLIWLATGAGFLHGRGWSWTLGMIFSVLSLLGAVGALAIGLITGGVGGLIFWGLILYYLTRTHVKAFFGKGGLPHNPAHGLPYHWDLKSTSPKSQQMPAMGDHRQRPRRSLFRPSHKEHQRVFLRPVPSRQPSHRPVRPSEPRHQSVPIVTLHFRWARESVLLAAQPCNSSFG